MTSANTSKHPTDLDVVLRAWKALGETERQQIARVATLLELGTAGGYADPERIESVITSSFLARAAERFPCRVIPGEMGPYLSRYTLAEFADGRHLYLHHFHASDATSELHNHPWAGTSIILAGGYVEERLAKGGLIGSTEFRAGDVNTIGTDTFHRVELLDDVAGCWSLFMTSARTQTWGFLDRETREFRHWREALRARGIPIDPAYDAARRVQENGL